ncbi:MAG: hypothetical protein WC467_00955 [Patescibacteria group bacterium]
MEKKITDAEKIAKMLAEYVSLKIEATERGTDAGFIAIVKAMKKIEFNNFDLNNLNIDLAALEALAKKHQCYNLLFSPDIPIVTASFASKKTPGQLLDIINGFPGEPEQAKDSKTLMDSEAYP